VVFDEGESEGRVPIAFPYMLIRQGPEYSVCSLALTAEINLVVDHVVGTFERDQTS
jgi:hypothetical protein